MLGSGLVRGVPRKAGQSREQVAADTLDRDGLHGANSVLTYVVTTARQRFGGSPSQTQSQETLVWIRDRGRTIFRPHPCREPTECSSTAAKLICSRV